MNLSEHALQLLRQTRQQLPLDLPLSQRRVHLLRFMLKNSLARLPLPTDCQPKPVHIRGVPCEWFSAGHFLEQQIIIWFHGGFHHMGSLATHRHLAASLAVTTSSRVLLVQPRQCPRYHCEQTLADARSVWAGLCSNGYLAEQLVLGGDDAGAALALSVACYLRDNNAQLPAGLLLLEPWTDLTNSQIRQPLVATDVLRKEHLDWFATHWLDGQLSTHPEYSPFYADLSALPSTLIQTSEGSLLHADAQAIAARLERCGNDKHLIRYPSLPHGWYLVSSWLAAASDAMAEINCFLRRLTTTPVQVVTDKTTTMKEQYQ